MKEALFDVAIDGRVIAKDKTAREAASLIVRDAVEAMAQEAVEKAKRIEAREVKP